MPKQETANRNGCSQHPGRQGYRHKKPNAYPQVGGLEGYHRPEFDLLDTFGKGCSHLRAAFFLGGHGIAHNDGADNDQHEDKDKADIQVRAGLPPGVEDMFLQHDPDLDADLGKGSHDQSQFDINLTVLIAFDSADQGLGEFVTHITGNRYGPRDAKTHHGRR